MILDQIQTDLNAAMKSRDQVRVDTLRFLLGAVRSLEIEKYPPGSEKSLNDEDVLSVLSKQVKSHKESIEMFDKGNRPELVEKETVQLQILESYLPEQMSEEEIRSKVQGLRSKNPDADFPFMIKLVMGEMRGKADGAVVSRLLRDIMSS